MNSEAWEYGYRGYVEGLSFSENPYSYEDEAIEFMDWESGWYAAAWDD